MFNSASTARPSDPTQKDGVIQARELTKRYGDTTAVRSQVCN